MRASGLILLGVSAFLMTTGTCLVFYDLKRFNTDQGTAVCICAGFATLFATGIVRILIGSKD
jgi:hypothetical protein